MISANQIREVIDAYVQDGNADAFVLEFSKLAFGINQHGDEDAVKLAQAVEGRIALVHAGHLSPAALRDWLRGNMPIQRSERPEESSTRIVIVAPMILGDFLQYKSGSSVTLSVGEKAILQRVTMGATQGQHETVLV
jgi:hypothetical protein